MQLYAPAKINLSLQIKRRRQDGFHEIETLMSPITLADRLIINRVKPSHGGMEFSCSDSSLPTGEDNLVVRAATLFRSTTGVKDGIQIALEKNIPHGAGLGGGSSDAATTLLGLNQLFETNLTDSALFQFAGQIGSDVPFFIAGSAAICRGRGEVVEPTPLTSKLNL